MNIKTSLLSSVMILPVLLFSSVELASNSHTAPYHTSEHNTSSSFKVVEMLPLEELLNKIRNNEKVVPNVVVATLKVYYAQFDADVNVAITLKLTPVFHLLNDNYNYYKIIILDMYSDKTNHRLLRMPMLEIIGYHLDDTTSLDAIKAVFTDKSDDPLIVGQSAELLTKKGIDISQEVENRYPNSDDISKPFYARILAFFGVNGSREMIERDMDSETDGNKKIKLISAFAKTGIDDDYVINKLMDMIYITIPNSHYLPIEKDIISIQIIQALAKSTRDDIYMNLLDIASNNSFYLDTRAIALSQLTHRTPTVDKSIIKQKLEQLSQDILSSPNDFKDERYQNLLNDDVLQVINALEGV